MEMSTSGDRDVTIEGVVRKCNFGTKDSSEDRSAQVLAEATMSVGRPEAVQWRLAAGRLRRYAPSELNGRLGRRALSATIYRHAVLKINGFATAADGRIATRPGFVAFRLQDSNERALHRPQPGVQ
jgi:hypothetical protein